jgi:hypothetical protein
MRRIGGSQQAETKPKPEKPRSVMKLPATDKQWLSYIMFLILETSSNGLSVPL